MLYSTNFTHAYVGPICGKLWAPAVTGWTRHGVDLRREQSRFINGDGSYREILEHILTEKGGDFQNPLFPADAEIEVIMTYTEHGRRHKAYRTVPIARVAPDLCNNDVFACDLESEAA